MLSCFSFVISVYLEAHPNKFTVGMLETPLRVGVPFQVYFFCFTPFSTPFLRGCSSRRGWGEIFLVMGQWVCATGWGRISTTGLTIIGNNGFAFSVELLELGLRFSGFCGKKSLHLPKSDLEGVYKWPQDGQQS